MYWEQIAFFFFAGGFFMISIIKTIDKYRQSKIKYDLNQQDKKLIENESVNKISSSSDRTVLIKLIINYSAGVNNRFLLV
jgi:hypothetical protein